MEKDIAIKVENVSKTFRIPHEKVSSLRGAAINLLKSGGYEEFKALDDISFEIKKGEFFGIIGRNGSGKSTLLKILAGIYKADKGGIHINGRISPFLELGIGFNPELSGRDNIYLNATVLGLTKKQIDEKFDSIVAFSELERFIDQKLKNYSSGMQVRLAFSVSIHANRDILLMDEVLAVGDSNFQSKCLEEFKRYKSLGKTVILVTHDISVVRQHCNKAILIRNGKIEKMGNVNDVCNKYLIENINDKNKEIKKSEENKNKKNDFGSKEIIINEVEILDEKNRKKRSFICGEKMKIEIKYNAKKTIFRPHFGILISDVNGTPLIATNHLRNNQIIEKIEKGKEDSIIFVLRKIPFVAGEFSINVMLYTDKIGKIPEPIHHINNVAIFSVFNKNTLSDEGIIFADCEWEVNTTDQNK